MASGGGFVGGLIGAVAGFFIGGPTGAMYGYSIGSMAGSYLDPPKGPTSYGPRLDDLSIQTSTYGAPIPRVYGSITVMGNIFWLENNKLKESRKKTKVGGGKSSSTSVTYTYSATFAVGLCEGPIAGVRRIWVGSKLIYDAGAASLEAIMASNQSSSLCTVYKGDNTQTADTRMQATLGIANTPAYRGLAYIVFKDYPLAEHSNSLLGAQVKVEVVTIGSITKTVSLVGQIAGTSDSAQLVGMRQIDNLLKASIYGLYNGAYGWISGYVETIMSVSGSTLFSVNKSLAPSTVANTRVNPVRNEFAEYICQCTVEGVPNMYLCREQQVIAPLISISYTEFRGLPVKASYDYGDCYFAVRYFASNTPVYLMRYLCGETGLAIDSGHPLYYDVGFSTPYDNSDVELSISEDGSMLCMYSYGGMSRAGITGTVYVAVFNARTMELLSYTTDQMRPVGFISRGLVVYQGSSLYVRDPLTFGYIEHYTGFTVGSVTAAVPLMINDSIAEYYGRLHALFAPITSNDPDLSSIVQAECLKSNLLTAADIDVTQLTQSVRGYKVSTESALRSSLEPLMAAFRFEPVQAGYQIKFKPRGQTSVATISANELGARSDT